MQPLGHVDEAQAVRHAGEVKEPARPMEVRATRAVLRHREVCRDPHDAEERLVAGELVERQQGQQRAALGPRLAVLAVTVPVA